MSAYRTPPSAPRRPYAAPVVRRRWWWHLCDWVRLVHRPWQRRSTWYRKVGATEENFVEVRRGLQSIIDGFKRHWFYGAAMATYEVEKAIEQARAR
jgi:hypothetical protein